MELQTEQPRRTGPKPRQIECRGERLTIEEWAERTGLQAGTIRYRLNELKWPASLALSLPLGTHASRAGAIEPEQLRAVVDVTEEPRKKAVVTPSDVDKDRAEVVADLLRRMNEYRAVETPESALIYAYNRGLKAGQDGAR